MASRMHDDDDDEARERNRIMEMRLWSPEKTIDQLRQRIYLFTRTISHMNNSLNPMNQNPSPPSWDDIASFQSTVVKQLQDIHTILREQAPFLNAAHVSPTDKFPYDAEGVVQFLLRKRLDPTVDNWRDKMRKEGEALKQDKLPGDDTMQTDEPVEWQSLWNWAAGQATQIVGDVFSSEELEYEEEAVVDNTPKDKSLPSARNPTALEDVLKFQSTGRLPAGR